MTLLADNGAPDQLGEVISSREREPENPFRTWWNLGYHSIIPIVPPNAQLYDRSALKLKLDKGKDDRGKAPGIKASDGLWMGFRDWQTHETTEANLDVWHAMGAGVGLPDDGGLVLLDIDATDEDTANRIERDALMMLGDAPMRVGSWPKRALLYQIDEQLPFMMVEFQAPTGKNRIEILAKPKQLVVHGVHPKTGRPYEWRRPIVARDKLTTITRDKLDAFFALQRTQLPAATVTTSDFTADRGAVDQDTLKGDIELVRCAVQSIPNTAELFPHYDDMVRMGEAIHAATADDPDAGLDIFDEWASRWEGDDYDPGVVEARWKSFKAPHAIGAPFLYAQASKHGGEAGSAVHSAAIVAKWFDPITALAAIAAENVAECSSFAWIDPSSWEGMAVPPMEWIVPGWIPKGEVTLLYGDGGVGKTLLLQQFGTAAATGRDWLGLQTRKCRVMLFLCEDGASELHRRQVAIVEALGVSLSDCADLRIVSRKNEENLLSVFDRSSGTMKLTKAWKTLRDDATAFGADVVVIDTIADTFGGSEIDRAQVNAFAKGCLGRLASEIGGTVVALGHPSQAGRQNGDGSSGSTAWNNAVRSRLYLECLKDDPSSPIRTLSTKKSNYGPKGGEIKLRWARGVFSVIAGSTPRIAGEGSSTVMISLSDAAETAVVSVLLDRPGERLAMIQNSPYFAPKVLKRLGGEALAPFSQPEVDAAIRRLLAAGKVRENVVGKDGSSRPFAGLVPDLDKLSAPAPATTSAFE